MFGNVFMVKDIKVIITENYEEIVNQDYLENSDNEIQNVSDYENLNSLQENDNNYNLKPVPTN